MFWMKNNKLNFGYIELEVFVAHPNRDVPWTLRNKDLEFIRTKVFRICFHINDH